MDETEQRRWLEALASAAKAEGCWVAPVGSLYFLVQGVPRQFTKDVDAVIHGSALEVASLDVLKRIAARLGEAKVTVDEAVVWVPLPSAGPGAKIELIRGRTAAKGGFFPRELLREAAGAAERRDNLLLYPLEYVLVLKADAAIDREERAIRDPGRSEEHRRRAAAFRTDVFGEVNRAMLGPGLDARRLSSAVSHLKERRREAVRALLRAAGAP